jgi:lipopolysaccharide export system protein LptA
MRFGIVRLAAAAVCAALPLMALAQGAQVPFGSFQHDTSAPVEVTAEQLSIDQSDGTAIFSGNVVVGQGEMRLTAATVRVRYAGQTGDAAGRIERLEASGGVTLVSGAEAAESREAVYTIDSGVIVMTGDVILTQGQNALSAQKLTVNLENGTGLLEGGVRTILQTGANP